MKVLKFGGTSVGSVNAMNQVIKIVLEAATQEPIIVVSSAMSGVTDQLIHIAQLASKSDESYKQLIHKLEEKHFATVKELIDVKNQSNILSCIKKYINEIEIFCEGISMLQELSARSLDRIQSYGELISTKILYAKLSLLDKFPVQWIDSRTLIKTDHQFGVAKVDYELSTPLMESYFTNNVYQIYVVPGFIASTKENITTTLGRGGSDLTGAIYAKCIQASSLEIWTDVSGMMTADPRIVSTVKPINRISYHEALELSHFGAKIIYPPTIQPVMSMGIPVWIKNTFSPKDEGTLIENESTNTEIVRGISSVKDICLLNLEGPAMLGIPGFSKRLFGCLADENISVILITQSSSEYSICVAIHKKDSKKAKVKIDHEFHLEIRDQKINPLIVENNLAIIALVGEKMKSHPGISGKLFSALGKNGINVRAIAQGSSEKNISTVISEDDIRKAVNVLHEAFFDSTKKQLNVFVIGVGNVGSKLLEQFKQQEAYLLKNQNLQINVVGLANSKQVLIDEQGIDIEDWKALLLASPKNNVHYFVQEIIHKNLRNSVFVDITANADVASVYNKLLEKSIAIIACNKIACSRGYEEYKNLKKLTREFNTSFLFETNVGAGLPIIGTLNDLLKSGDKIHSIKAVLSGTLNYVFNTYDASVPFADVVKKAQDEGYTEPDPRLDLGGTDVMRKILILARESGQQMEMNEIENNGFLPASCFEGSVADFYKELRKHESHFKDIYEKAKKENCKLKFVASFEFGKAKVQLEHVSADSPFYHLYGKDNLVLFHTKRYYEQPLVIKGAGAGADVTASGIFADIIRAVKN